MKFLGIDLIRFVHLLAMLAGKRAMRLSSLIDAISTWKAFGYVEKDNFYDKGGSKRCLYGMHEMQEIQKDGTHRMTLVLQKEESPFSSFIRGCFFVSHTHNHADEERRREFTNMLNELPCKYTVNINRLVGMAMDAQPL